MKTVFIGVLLFAQASLPIGQRIIQASIQAGVDPIMSLDVARCESAFMENAIGDHGLARGIYQFHEQTFNRFKEEAGAEYLSYSDTNSQISLFLWAIKQGYGSHWTCWRQVVHGLS